MHNGLPGVATGRTATPRKVLVTDRHIAHIPGGVVIDGSKARDPLNSNNIAHLRAGLVMGKITSGGKYAPSIIGLTTVLHDTSVATTTMTLPEAVVTEIQRRIGASGTFKITGPPTEAGTVATETVTYSAIASSTTLTITATSADFAVGSVIRPTDGSETPLCLIADNRDVYGIRVIDQDSNDLDVPFPQPVIGGFVDASQIINYSSDASVKTWLKDQLNAVGRFFFDDDF